MEVESIATPRPAPAPRVEIPAEATAYIYYTSGSTGEPKGVFDTHRNVLHNVMRYTNSLGIGADDRLTLLQGPAFSGAVSSMLGALLNGAALYPFDVPQEGADRIGPWLAEHELTMYHSVPALFRRVAAAGRPLPALRVVRLEGDLAVPRDLELFQARCGPGTTLVNGLGATECGLVRQYVVDHRAALPRSAVPVGYPVEDMDVLLVDPEGRRVAAGEVGEIAVQSHYVASGYWDRPDLTEAAFRAPATPGGPRLYRTGDMGRMAADGCLDHLGRRDQQVKIRGERVDVESIQAALLSSGVARETVVTAQRSDHGDAHRRRVRGTGARGAAHHERAAARSSWRTRRASPYRRASYCSRPFRSMRTARWIAGRCRHPGAIAPSWTCRSSRRAPPARRRSARCGASSSAAGGRSGSTTTSSTWVATRSWRSSSWPGSRTRPGSTSE
jgi:acyl-coenzyme A synthetase/AMP-(fatty) acid ligase